MTILIKILKYVIRNCSFSHWNQGTVCKGAEERSIRETYSMDLKEGLQG